MTKNKSKKKLSSKPKKKTSSLSKRDQDNMLRQKKHKVLVLLDTNPDKVFSIRQLQKAFQASAGARKTEFIKILHLLVEQGKIAQVSEKQFKSNQKRRLATGVVDFVNPKYGFITCEGEEEDVWVAAEDMNQAFHGDEVEIEVIPGRRKKEGKVSRVLTRNRTSFVGRVQVNEKFAFVILADRKMHTDFFVNLGKLNDAVEGDKVIVDYVGWREGDKNPTGKVSKVLGKSGLHETEIHAIMYEFGLPFEFPEEIDKEADAISNKISSKEIEKRKDFREVTTFTIDPLTAKDFDDAISIQKVDDLWEIGVHIADVTHYVKPDTLLEKEAQKRGSSVYLVDRTVPMLPENLSNGLCSLRPNEDKLTFSAVFKLDEEGNVKSEWFGRTIIHSDRRFTYEEAQERIESKEGDFADEINVLNGIAKKLSKKKFQNGAISFESVELRFELDEDGRPLRLVPKVRQEAHKLVEEFMLLANKRVAEFVYAKRSDKQEKIMVYRTHDAPDPEKIMQFIHFAKRFGHELKSTDPTHLAAAFNKLSAEVEGKPEQNIVESQAIRTMSKARYTIETLGHYGLGFAHYTHFTSPIRRYPDMMAHRLLQRYLDNGSDPNPVEINQLCKHSSEKEKVAADAERASIKYKQVEFIGQLKNEVLEGMISGTTEWGLYVELEETRCEGMIRLSDLYDDHYSFDQEKQMVIGQDMGRTFQLGDKVKVRVADTNLEKRTIDFQLVD